MITVQTDRSEYCRYEDAAVITVRITATVGVLPVALRVALIHPNGTPVIIRRVAGGVAGVTTTLDLNGATADAELGERAAVHDGINFIRRGRYVVAVYDGDAGTPLASSGEVAVVVVSAEHLRTTHLFGVPLHAEQVLAVLSQPRLITGATVVYVDPGMLKGTGQLAYVASERTLRWRGGAAVAIDPAEGVQTVQLLTPEQDAYLEVEVDPAALPLGDRAESLLIDNWRMTTRELRRYLDNAYDQIEQALQISLEPRIVTTDPDPTITPAYDEVAPAIDRDLDQRLHVALTSRHARPIRAVLRLAGYQGGQQVATFDLGRAVVQAKAGVIDLTGGVVAPTAHELQPYRQLRQGRRFIPGYWHYTVVAGLGSLANDRFSIREAIAKQAALDVLIDLSLAATGGRTSRSAQRDGVSESWSFSPQGAYSEKITAYQQWLQATLPRLKQFYTGFTMETL